MSNNGSKCFKKNCPCGDWRNCDPGRINREEKRRMQMHDNGCIGRQCPCGMQPNCPRNRDEAKNHQWKARNDEIFSIIALWYAENFRGEIKSPDGFGNG